VRPPRLPGWVRRRLPKTVRLRLSGLYALLFLAAGAALLALTYGLVASSLPQAASYGNPSQIHKIAKLEAACKASAVSSTKTGVPAPGKKPQPVGISPICKRAFAAGASLGASSQRDQALHNLLLYSLVGLGAMSIASGWLGWLVAGRVLRPVSAITEAARRSSERHLGERLNLRGPDDELKELADTFDAMLDRLDAAFTGQRRFIADASHELRTPLTVMRTAIDVTLSKPTRTADQLEAMAIKLRRSVDQAERLIDALLTLAMSDGTVGTREFVDLATAAEDALELARPEIARLDLQLEADLQPAETNGDRDLLERLVGNLVDNAVRHNRAAGEISVRTGNDDGHPYIEVTNSGPMIPAELVPSLFEPFHRLEERTSVSGGVGLGLAIVKSISAVHGATLNARPLPNGGLSVSVVLLGAAVSRP